LPELRPAYDGLWSVLAKHLRRHKVRGVPETLSTGVPLPGIFTDPLLLVGQCCGYDLIHGFAGSLSIIGTPCFDVPGCAGGKYRSCVLVRDDDPQLRDLEGLRGAVCVVNGFNSHSGTNALRALVAPLSRNGRFFLAVRVSGGHQKSLAQLLGGQADVMAMDGILYEILRRHRPDALRGTQILCWSEPAPAPPFVTSATTDRDELNGLRAAFADTLIDTASQEARTALLLDGINFSTLEDYARIVEIEASALGHGYMELHASSPIVQRETG